MHSREQNRRPSKHGDAILGPPHCSHVISRRVVRPVFTIRSRVRQDIEQYVLGFTSGNVVAMPQERQVPVPHFAGSMGRRGATAAPHFFEQKRYGL
jgi:hypothetical protein